MKLLEMQKEGHRFHPLKGKKPMHPNWPDSDPDEATLLKWINDPKTNIGWIQGPMVATLDFDDLKIAQVFWKENGPFNCTLQKTRRGIHMTFRQSGNIGNAVNVNGMYDVRGNRGYLKIWKFIDGYDTTDPEKLDVFREDWLPIANPVVSNEITNVRNYLMKIESFQGKAGNKGLIRAIARCRDNGLSIAETTMLILEWNRGPTVEPEWKDSELSRAITSMYEIKNG
jgi:hypothetical protein